MSTRAPRLGIGIIGAGRVGAVLGHVLRARGHAITGVSGNSAESRERAQTLLPGVPMMDSEVILDRSEAVFFTVPDSVLADVVAGHAALGHFREGQIVLHCAGRFGTSVLAPAQGVHALALHPALSFTGTRADVEILAGTTMAVTGASSAIPIGQALAVEMGAEPIVIAEADRPLYHAALAHVGNHLGVLVGQATEALQALGVQEPANSVGPMAYSALARALRAGPRTITGPVSRGDVGTLMSHLHALADYAGEAGTPEALDTYRVLSRAAVSRALRHRQITEAQAAELMDRLGGETD